MIRTLIVDDELLALDLMQSLLSVHDDVDILGVYRSGTKALDAIRSLSPDLVFLDIQMPGMSGFVSEITVFLGITSNDAFTTGFRVITIVLAAIGLVLTPMYLLSMCRRVFCEMGRGAGPQAPVGGFVLWAGRSWPPASTTPPLTASLPSFTTPCRPP